MIRNWSIVCVCVLCSYAQISCGGRNSASNDSGSAGAGSSDTPPMSAVGGATQSVTETAVTVGAECGAPGELACVANSESLSVVCGAADVWEPLTTCDNGRICDSRPEGFTGTCVAPSPRCEGIPDGEGFCDGTAAYMCSSGGLESFRNDCTWDCRDGFCVLEECLPASFGVINCANDCQEPSVGCHALPPECGGIAVGVRSLVRTPAAGDACACGDGASGIVEVRLELVGRSRIRVATPWWVASADDPCEPTVRTFCLEASGTVAIRTSRMDAGPMNVVVDSGFGDGC